MKHQGQLKLCIVALTVYGLLHPQPLHSANNTPTSRSAAAHSQLLPKAHGFYQKGRKQWLRVSSNHSTLICKVIFREMIKNA